MKERLSYLLKELLINVVTAFVFIMVVLVLYVIGICIKSREIYQKAKEVRLLNQKTKVFLIFLFGFLIGASAQKYYDDQGKRRAVRIISKASAAVALNKNSAIEKAAILSKGVETTHYEADACIVWCFDDRFSGLLDEFIKSRGYKKVDIVKVAGGAKDLLANNGYIVDQIKKSCALHHSREIVFMVHLGCGAYGGNEDPSFYSEELEVMRLTAREILAESTHPPVVKTVLAQFDGLYELK